MAASMNPLISSHYIIAPLQHLGLALTSTLLFLLHLPLPPSSFLLPPKAHYKPSSPPAKSSQAISQTKPDQASPSKSKHVKSSTHMLPYVSHLELHLHLHLQFHCDHLHIYQKHTRNTYNTYNTYNADNIHNIYITIIQTTIMHDSHTLTYTHSLTHASKRATPTHRNPISRLYMHALSISRTQNPILNHTHSILTHPNPT